MGKVGRHIDTFTDAERDRVIEGQDWCFEWVDGGCKCLIGHKRGMRFDSKLGLVSLPEYGPLLTLGTDDYTIGVIVAHLMDKRGIDRVVAAMKARAAKRHNPCTPSPTNTEQLTELLESPLVGE